MSLAGYRVAVVGAGIGGLASAYMLARHGAEVLVFERDPPPPDDVEAAFATWKRGGATQIRHSHVFLGRLRALLRDSYPEVLEALLLAGIKEMRPLDHPPPALRGRLVPEPGDEDLVALAGRRVTFEWVLRRLVEQHPRVEIYSGTTVTGLLGAPTSPPQVCGVWVTQPRGRKCLFRAHFVVDASGRHSVVSRWLASIGCNTLTESREDSGIAYYTRFYRVLPTGRAPDPGHDPWVGDWDWIKFAVFPAEDGVFSLTFAVPLAKKELKVLARAPAFDRMARAIPGLRDWVDPKVAEPLRTAPHPVEAMGGLLNRRRRLVRGREPIVLRLFCIGDAAYCTNPLYGRGCTQAFLHAHQLTQALLESRGDFRLAALLLDERARRDIEPFYRASILADRDAMRRAAGQAATGLSARMLETFFRDGVAVAMRTDPVVYRAFLRMINMFETPEEAFLRPEVVARTLWVMGRGERFRKEHGWSPPPPADLYLARLRASGHAAQAAAD
ncbi:Putative epoxidase LasC [bacterium HR30]|nr:Putative epoxidase LasC [bacterium HR30]